MKTPRIKTASGTIGVYPITFPFPVRTEKGQTEKELLPRLVEYLKSRAKHEENKHRTPVVILDSTGKEVWKDGIDTGLPAETFIKEVEAFWQTIMPRLTEAETALLEHRLVEIKGEYPRVYWILHYSGRKV